MLRALRLWMLLVLGVAVLSTAVLGGCAVFGARPDDAAARLSGSPQWRDGRFHNPQPMWNDIAGGLAGFLAQVPDAAPAAAVPVGRPALQTPPASGLRVTWFGHSSTLIEIDGARLLLDPIWSERASPFGFIGPARWFEPPIALSQLPVLDAVLISHDHYDHLDMQTLKALAARQPALRFIVPLGVGAHLRRWGIADARITELDWWKQAPVGQGLTVTATPARHAAGRIDPQANHALWAGWAVHGPAHRVWYSGDTGTHEMLSAIGQRLGPFDLTLVENGQYDAAWPDWHAGPEFAVEAHRLVGGKRLLPVHWGLFRLANHGWTEPGERVLAAARCQGVDLMLPRPGESVEPATAPPAARWWPAEARWRTAAQAPIRPTRDGQAAHRLPQPACVVG